MQQLIEIHSRYILESVEVMSQLVE